VFPSDQSYSNPRASPSTRQTAIEQQAASTKR